MNINKIKKIIILLIITLTLIIITLIAFLSSYKIIYLNNYIYSKQCEYNINRKLWYFRKNGGIPIQVSASILSYLGVTISSLFNQDIKNDMLAIDWNIFNTDETSVINAQKVSFYKGVPVFKFKHNRSGSFLAIFISYEQESIDTLHHEFGHNIQQLLLGPIKYLLCIRFTFMAGME